MNKEKSTIYDYVRMCRFYRTCSDCPMRKMDCALRGYSPEVIDEINELILNWCKEHPEKTRQDKFLEMFPNPKKDRNGIIFICPKLIEGKSYDNYCHGGKYCDDCKKSYWLAEVED